MQLQDSKLKVHLIVLKYLEFVQFLENSIHRIDVLGYTLSHFRCKLSIDLGSFKAFPKVNHLRAEGLYAEVKFIVECIHPDEIFTLEVALLLILRLVHLHFLDLCDFIQ